MGQWVILIVVALVAALLMGRDPGLEPAEPDGRAIPLPTARPLTEADLTDLRFDITARGYRMAQVDQALRRVAYDIGYKEELVGVLEAEIAALREGRTADADALQQAREAAQRPRPASEAVLGGSDAADAGDLPDPDAGDLPDPDAGDLPEAGHSPVADTGRLPVADAGRSPVGDAGDEVAPAAPEDRADDAEQGDGKPAGDDPAVDEWVATGAGTSATSEGQPGGGAK